MVDSNLVPSESSNSRLKIFISWHEQQSRTIAQALYDWLPNVIQNTDPFFSPKIEKGTKGLNEVHARLEESNFGIICLTPENLNSNWIHFEAGALAKLREDSRVYTLLYNLKPTDVIAPLSQFQHTFIEKEDVFQLVDSINSFAKHGVAEGRLRSVFDKWWPDLESALESIPPARESEPIAAEGVEVSSRPERDMIEEILENVRRITNDNFTSQSMRMDSSKRDYPNNKKNPYAPKTLGDLITAKQIGKIRSLTSEIGMDANDYAMLQLGHPLTELNRQAGDGLIHMLETDRD